LKKILIAYAVLLAFLPALLPAAAGKDIHVGLEIDYGPANKKSIKKTVTLPEGSTVLDALIKAAPAEQGLVCCNKKDVESIDGVKCDPESESWWLYEINGHKGPVSAFRLILEDGDNVRWFYSKLGSIMEKPASEYHEKKVSQGASLSGSVTSEADIPVLPEFTVHKNAEACDAGNKVHPCQRAYKGKNLGQAIAWLEEVPNGKAWPKSFPDKATLDQKSCVFSPHLIIGRIGTEIELKNSDPVRHTVHAYDHKKKTAFHVAMAGRKSHSKVSLDQTGLFDVQCDAGHRWMRAHVFVAPNPYYAVTDDQGNFEIADIPPGTYTLKVWHDLFGEKSRTVTVGPGGKLRENWTFTAAEFKPKA
jgi:plastocyanin